MSPTNPYTQLIQNLPLAPSADDVPVDGVPNVPSLSQRNLSDLPGLPPERQLPDLPDIGGIVSGESPIPDSPLPIQSSFIPDFSPTSMTGLISSTVSVPSLSNPTQETYLKSMQQSIGTKLQSTTMGQVIQLQIAIAALGLLVSKLAGLVGGLPGLPTLKLPSMPAGFHNPFSAESQAAVANLVPDPTPKEKADEILKETAERVRTKWQLTIKEIPPRKNVRIADMINQDKELLAQIDGVEQPKIFIAIYGTVTFEFLAKPKIKQSDLLNNINTKIINGRSRRLIKLEAKGVVFI